MLTSKELYLAGQVFTLDAWGAPISVRRVRHGKNGKVIMALRGPRSGNPDLDRCIYSAGLQIRADQAACFPSRV